MTVPPVFTPIGSIVTMGDMIRRVLQDVNEPVNAKNQNQVADYINDGIESIWMSMLLASLSRFSKGPVTQVVPAGQTSVGLISVPDPTIAPTVVGVVGKSPDVATLYFSYCLVTDSGSTTKISPLAPYVPTALAVAQMLSPVLQPSWNGDIIGYYVFAGLRADGADQVQQSPLVPIGHVWTESPGGLAPAPNAPPAPAYNTTADNIFNIVRMDVQNVDTTWTNWLQSHVGSIWFTDYQKRVSTTTTFLPFVYDFISDRQLEVRPAPGADISATYFYTTRPRRLRFMQSRFPYPQFAGITEFVHDFCLGKFTLGVYEYDASDRWLNSAKDARSRVTMEISQGNFYQNTTVRPFMR